MQTHTLLFPSGRTVERCRQDAKSLVKELKLSNSPITLNVALDRIASGNGIKLPWAKAIEQLKITNVKKPKVAQIHLLGHALNLLIKKGLVDMNSTDDAGDSYLECDLLEKPSIINWSYISHGEIRLSVWWNFDKTKHPQHLEGGYKNRIILDNLSDQEKMKYAGTQKGIFSNGNSVEKYTGGMPLAKSSKYKDFVGVLCSIWVERKDGKYLQTKNGKHIFESYIRAHDKKALCLIPDCIPLDFEITGRFHM
jgi:hypothetical protein